MCELIGRLTQFMTGVLLIIMLLCERSNLSHLFVVVRKHGVTKSYHWKNLSTNLSIAFFIALFLFLHLALNGLDM